MDDLVVESTPYYTLPTAVGKAKIAAAILSGKKVNITHIAVGDGGGAYYEPTEDQTGLVNECWRGEVASYRISGSVANMIDITALIPATVGGFYIREGMAIDEDGDAIALWNTPDIEKRPSTDGVSFPLDIVAHIVVEDASVVTITVNPALDTVSRSELEAALAEVRDAAGSIIIAEITIPVDEWEAHELTDEEYQDYPYMAEVAVEGCTEKHFPIVALARSSQPAAGAAGMSTVADTIDGAIQFVAAQIPTEDLVATVQLRTENLAYAEGSGDGCGCADNIATDEEAEGEIDDAFEGSGAGGSTDEVPAGYEVATTEEAEGTINGAFDAQS